jgi:F-type H+-transporting ATPase subunit b
MNFLRSRSTSMPNSTARSHRRRVALAITFATLICVMGSPTVEATATTASAAAQSAPAAQQPEHAAPAQQPAHEGASHAGAQEGKAEEKEHGSSVLQTIAKVFNFALLVGILVYYLRAPIAAYLASRSTQIRQDLVTAAETRAAATAQLAEIARKLKELPAELEALRKRGADDVVMEKQRIAQAAATERERLLEQTRREIEMRLRIARRELVELTAQLAVGAARERITRSITADDQMRLVDRYAAQLSGQTPGGELR